MARYIDLDDKGSARGANGRTPAEYWNIADAVNNKADLSTEHVYFKGSHFTQSSDRSFGINFGWTKPPLTVDKWSGEDPYKITLSKYDSLAKTTMKNGVIHFGSSKYGPGNNVKIENSLVMGCIGYKAALKNCTVLQFDQEQVQTFWSSSFENCAFLGRPINNGKNTFDNCVFYGTSKEYMSADLTGRGETPNSLTDCVFFGAPIADFDFCRHDNEATFTTDCPRITAMDTATSYIAANGYSISDAKGGDPSKIVGVTNMFGQVVPAVGNFVLNRPGYSFGSSVYVDLENKAAQDISREGTESDPWALSDLNGEVTHLNHRVFLKGAGVATVVPRIGYANSFESWGVGAWALSVNTFDTMNHLYRSNAMVAMTNGVIRVNSSGSTINRIFPIACLYEVANTTFWSSSEDLSKGINLGIYSYCDYVNADASAMATFTNCSFSKAGKWGRSLGVEFIETAFASNTNQYNKKHTMSVTPVLDSCEIGDFSDIVCNVEAPLYRHPTSLKASISIINTQIQNTKESINFEKEVYDTVVTTTVVDSTSDYSQPYSDVKAGKSDQVFERNNFVCLNWAGKDSAINDSREGFNTAYIGDKSLYEGRKGLDGHQVLGRGSYAFYWGTKYLDLDSTDAASSNNTGSKDKPYNLNDMSAYDIQRRGTTIRVKGHRKFSLWPVGLIEVGMLTKWEQDWQENSIAGYGIGGATDALAVTASMIDCAIIKNVLHVPSNKNYGRMFDMNKNKPFIGRSVVLDNFRAVIDNSETNEEYRVHRSTILSDNFDVSFSDAAEPGEFKTLAFDGVVLNNTSITSGSSFVSDQKISIERSTASFGKSKDNLFTGFVRDVPDYEFYVDTASILPELDPVLDRVSSEDIWSSKGKHEALNFSRFQKWAEETYVNEWAIRGRYLNGKTYTGMYNSDNRCNGSFWCEEPERVIGFNRYIDLDDSSPFDISKAGTQRSPWSSADYATDSGYDGRTEQNGDVFHLKGDMPNNIWYSRGTLVRTVKNWGNRPFTNTGDAWNMYNTVAENCWDLSGAFINNLNTNKMSNLRNSFICASSFGVERMEGSPSSEFLCENCTFQSTSPNDPDVHFSIYFHEREGNTYDKVTFDSCIFLSAPWVLIKSPKVEFVNCLFLNTFDNIHGSHDIEPALKPTFTDCDFIDPSKVYPNIPTSILAYVDGTKDVLATNALKWAKENDLESEYTGDKARYAGKTGAFGTGIIMRGAWDFNTGERYVDLSNNRAADPSHNGSEDNPWNLNDILTGSVEDNEAETIHLKGHAVFSSIPAKFRKAAKFTSWGKHNAWGIDYTGKDGGNLFGTSSATIEKGIIYCGKYDDNHIFNSCVIGGTAIVFGPADNSAARTYEFNGCTFISSSESSSCAISFVGSDDNKTVANINSSIMIRVVLTSIMSDVTARNTLDLAI